MIFKIICTLSIFILITLLVFIVCKCCKSFNSQFIDLKKIRYHYRLGDFILLPENKRQEHQAIPDRIQKQFKNSIADLYFQKTNKYADIDTLIQILKENNLLKRNNNISMHIRLGDVVCLKNKTKAPPPIEEILKIIDKNNDKIINIYSFYHYGCIEKSKEYIDKLKTRKNVIIHLNGSVDNDFIEMINSKYHFSGTGNFSKLIDMTRDKLYNEKDTEIPKIIYQTWFTKDIPKEILEYKNEILKKNPDYKYYLFDDLDMDNYVKNNYDIETYNNFNKLKVLTAKADFWRYLILNKTGGIYLDMDSTINIDLNTLINKNDHAIISREKTVPENYLQWCLIFKKNHPILEETIKLINYYISNNLYSNDIINLTGPKVFSKALNNIHNKYFINPLKWENKENKKYNTNTFNYTIYGFDFNEKLTFKNKKLNDLLDKHKKLNNLRHYFYYEKVL